MKRTGRIFCESAQSGTVSRDGCWPKGVLARAPLARPLAMIKVVAFSMINQQLKRDGYAASIDPSIFIWLANITDPEMRDTANAA